MFSSSGTSGVKKKGKQATKGDAQIVKENAETIQYYKNMLTITNTIFLAVHFIFYFNTGLSRISLILFMITSIAAWYVWTFMRQIGTNKSGGSITDLNLDGSISEYAKDIIIVIAITQLASLIHRYFWWSLLVIPGCAIYKGIMLYFFSPYAQLRSGANQEQDEDTNNKKGKRIVRVARH